jgi:hypothetical protein
VRQIEVSLVKNREQKVKCDSLIQVPCTCISGNCSDLFLPVFWMIDKLMLVYPAPAI